MDIIFDSNIIIEILFFEQFMISKRTILESYLKIEVVIEKGESTDSFDTLVSSPVNNDSPSILTLLQQVIDVKNGKLSLDQVTAIGIDSE